MGRSIFYILYTILFLFTSCEEDIDLRDLTFKPSVVVNSVFSVGKPWRVQLSFSRDRFNSEQKELNIDNAEVLITEKLTNRIIFLENEGGGIYSSSIYLPKPDRTYQLTVNVPGYSPITASSIAPMKADINIISDVIEELEFEINDSNKNYYIWNLVFTNNKNGLDSTNINNPSDLVKGINNYNSLSNYLENISNPKISDAEESGIKRTKYYFDFQKFRDDSQGSYPDPIKKKYLRLVTASKELYEYYKTIEKYSISDNHNCSFCHIPDIKSNINNGLGVFAGFTEDFKEIK